MRHRHLDIDPATPVGKLGPAAIDDILDRGDLDDWKPLLDEIGQAPWGPVAEHVLRLVEQHPMYGTSRLWQSWIEEQRSEDSPSHAGASLRELRLRRGLTQLELGSRLGMTQPEVSRLEHRRDVRLSTARSYVRVLGGRLVLAARFGERDELL